MWAYPEIRSLADIPRFHARLHPDKPALLFRDRLTTFRELDLASNRIANAVLSLQLPPDSRIAFLGKNSDIFMIVLFGVMKAGLTLVPLNWRLALPEIIAVLEDSSASVLFFENDATSDVEALVCAVPAVRSLEIGAGSLSWPHLEDWLDGFAYDDPQVPVTGSATALQIYTSGTTGMPKGVELTHEGFNYILLNEHLSPDLGWQERDVFLFALPNFHLAGVGMALQAIHSGVPLSIITRFDSLHAIQTIEKTKVSVLYLVPSAIHLLLEEPVAAMADFASLRLIMYAGSPITPVLITRALERMSCRFLQIYGATETSSAVTVLAPEDHRLDDRAVLSSCGKPVGLIEVKVLDADGRLVPNGEVGEFWIRTPGIMKGYWRKPKETADVLHHGWYKSGDAGYRTAEGLLFLVDRIKDMVISGGENVYSAEVERVVSEHPNVQQVAIIGLPDERWGEAVSAVVILKSGATLSEEELVQFCRPRLAGYKIPRRLLVTDAFPMSDSGKILKRELRERYRTLS